MRKLKAGIDLDNILWDTNVSWCNLYNEFTGSNLQIKDITEWKITKFVPPEHGELMLDLLNNERLWNNVKPLPEAQIYMKLLSADKNVELYIATDTSPQTSRIKIDLFQKFYPYVNLDKHLFITGNKQMLNLDVLLDDYEGNLINANYKGILLTYPWNQSFKADGNHIVRANCWSEAYSAIQRMVNE